MSAWQLEVVEWAHTRMPVDRRGRRLSTQKIKNCKDKKKKNEEVAGMTLYSYPPLRPGFLRV